LLLDLVLFTAGVALLVGGAWLLVTGGSRIAAVLGMAPVVVGLTVVAWGTSAPELFVCLIAAIRGNPGLMFGNVIGSNVANLGLILGLAALIAPVRVEWGLKRLELPLLWGEIPMLMVVTPIFAALAWDGDLNRADGFILVALFVAFMWMTLKMVPRSVTVDDSVDDGAAAPARRGRLLLLNTVYVLLGIGGLTGGAHVINGSALSLAVRLGASETLIGLSLVAVGTSLPELATTAVAAWRKESDIALGNIVGSNLFNLLAVAGPVALIHPVAGPTALNVRQLPAMVGITTMLLVVVMRREAVGRTWGLVLLLTYAAIMVWWMGSGG